jgi:hypothetical protein
MWSGRFLCAAAEVYLVEGAARRRAGLDHVAEKGKSIAMNIPATMRLAADFSQRAAGHAPDHRRAGGDRPVVFTTAFVPAGHRVVGCADGMLDGVDEVPAGGKPLRNVAHELLVTRDVVQGQAADHQVHAAGCEREGLGAGPDPGPVPRRSRRPARARH